MTSAELKHRVKLQEWAARIQDCRSSGLSVRAWCRQEDVTTATYYRWERELLTGVRRNGTPPSTTVTFAELPAPVQVSRNVAERCGTLRHTAYWKRQPGHLLRMRCGTAENAGKPSAPMLNDFTGADKVYIACGYTDLRKGIDGLARLVQQQFELDPFTNTLFLFCGRRRDRIKGLYWERDGFILLYKRLEQGAYQWPRSESEVKALTPQQYRWLMEGLQIEQPKAHRPVTGLTTV